MSSADGGPKWDVFIAYAGPDRPQARALYEALSSAGLRVFLDEEVLRPGDSWPLLLGGHVRAADLVAVLISEHTDRAHYVLSEIVLAVNQVRREGRRLVPVRLADVDLPYGMEQLHCVDMFLVGVDLAAQKLAAAVVDRRVAPVAEAGQVFCDRIPVPPKFFVGRDDLLTRLGDTLHPGNASVVIHAIRGLGGIGKTSLAAALVDAHRHEFDIVWWVRAEEPAVLVADLAELAPHIGVPSVDDLAETADHVRRRLETIGRPWLLVFDNVPDQATVAEWLARRGTGAIVLTSRSTYFPQADDVVQVDTFPPNIAERFLRDRVRRGNADAAAHDLGDVVERLGGLPLALEHAAAWVERVPNRTFARFVERYDSAAAEALSDGTSADAHAHTAATTWRVSIDAAGAEAPLAARLMDVLSFFAPDELPCRWLRDTAGDTYFDGAGAVAVDQALDALHTYSLITIASDDTVTVHRVVQAVTRSQAPDEALGAAIRILRCQPVGNVLDPVHWPTLARLMPHVLTVAASSALALPAHSRGLWQLLQDVSRYQRVSGAIREAIANATTAYEIATTHFPADEPDRLESRNNLALGLKAAGDLARAIPLLEANLADRERILGPDHPDTLTSRNNLAVGLTSAGQLERAAALYEANLADRERILGPDHPDTLTSRNNLAATSRRLGDLERAAALYEANLADRERILGPDHPDTLTSRNNLALALLEGGDVRRAIPLYESNLADRERVLGPRHPKTITSRNNLALACLQDGDVDRSVELMTLACADSDQALGPDHPATVALRRRLARVLRRQASGRAQGLS